MRLWHPYAYFALVALSILLGLFFAALHVITAVRTALRKRRWPAERKVRESWERVLARLVSATRVTEAGHFLVTIEVPPTGGASYRSPLAPLRLRGVARFDPRASARFENADSLPVLIEPQSREWVVVDFRALLEEDPDGLAATLARDDYVRHGRLRWRSVERVLLR
jgi:hypothetical protein